MNRAQRRKLNINREMAEAALKGGRSIKRRPGSKPVVQVTYADGSKKYFDAYYWSVFGPGIHKNLVARGLATVEEVDGYPFPWRKLALWLAIAAAAVGVIACLL